MKVKINNIDEFCEALKAGYKIISPTDTTFQVVDKTFMLEEKISLGKSTLCVTVDGLEYEKPDPLKIKCGKYYKTRDGRKACVVFYEIDKNAPFKGLVSREDRTRYWTENGTSWFDSKYDLVSEWKEGV